MICFYCFIWTENVDIFSYFTCNHRYRDTTILKESEHIQQSFDGKTATLHVSKVKRNVDAGVYKCVIKNDSGMDETSANIKVKKVDQKKKKEEEEVEETIEVEEEELPAEVKRGPFGVLLTKATQNKSVISVSSRSSKYSFHVVPVVFSGNTCRVNLF